MTQLVEYNIETAVIESLKTKYDIQEIKNGKDYAFVMEGLAEYRGIRLKIDEKHKELKKDALEYGRAVDAEKNRLKDLLEPGEEHLKSIRKAEDDRKDTIKAEKERIEQERVDGIRSNISTIQRYEILDPVMDSNDIKSRLSGLEKIEITGELFQEFTQEAQKVFDGVFSNVHNALIARIKWEKEEMKRKVEADRLEKQRVEQEEAQKKIDADKATIQAEKDNIARDKREAEIKEKARQDTLNEAKDKAEAEEKAKVAKEKAEAEEKARKESLRPDKEKIIAFASVILNLNSPELKSSEANHIVSNAIDEINGIAHQMAKKAKAL